MYLCFGRLQPLRAAGAVVCIVLLCGNQKLESQSSSLATPIPTSTNKLGQFDAPALSEVLEHLKVVGTAPWTGMQGTGAITYGDDKTTYSATLTAIGNTKFRLDAKTATGAFSIRINGRIGNIQEADGKTYPLLPETAASGIFQFQLPRLADLQTKSTVIDHGPTKVDGISLHRLTIERPFSAGQKNIATDLYFDPKTHLLAETANSIWLDGARSSILRTIIYGDYRQVEGVLIPFRFGQAIDGQKQWTLQLSDVQLNPSIQSAYFSF
jgi:hypothetical protein